MTENNYACTGNLWGRCGALGDALRRAAEAEAEIDRLRMATPEAFAAWCEIHWIQGESLYGEVVSMSDLAARFRADLAERSRTSAAARPARALRW